MSRRTALVAALLILAVYVTLTASSTLWDRDEPRFSRATVEMVRSGNYLYATFNGQVRPDKPILIYWLMSLPVRLLGSSAIACRLWSPLAAAAACLLTGLLAAQLFGGRAPLYAMLALATAPLMAQCGTAATVDAVLLALLVGAALTFVRALQRGATAGHYVLLGVLTAAALLLKGPAGLLVPVFIIPPTWWLARKHTPLRWRYLLGVGVVLAFGLAVYLAWALPANRATHGIVLGSGVGKHVVGRSLQPMEGHGTNYLISLPFYVFAILGMFFPWTLYLPGAISTLLGGRLGHPLARPVLIGWAVPVFLLVTVVATKLPHYALPIWPVLALAVAAVLAALEREALSSRDLCWLRYGVWFMAPVALVLAGALAVGPWLYPLTAVRVPGAVAASVLLAMTVLAAREHLRGRHRATVRVLGVGMAVFWLTCAGLVLPSIERYKFSAPMARVVNERVGAEAPVVLHDYDEPSLIFYLGRDRVPILTEPAAVAAWASQPGLGVLIITSEGLRRLRAQHGDLHLQRIVQMEGYNVGRGKWVQLEALQRRGGASRAAGP
jgi:4-amino-4-deoxy-L-arabinose transferase-like glycosyltransferase